MVATNRRAEYQRICSELGAASSSSRQDELKAELRGLIAEDDSYARGFIEDSLRRALRYLSEIVGREGQRPFEVFAEIHYPRRLATAIVGVSFLPQVGDSPQELADELGREIASFAEMNGFGWLIAELAVNGRSIALSS